MNSLEPGRKSTEFILAALKTLAASGTALGYVVMMLERAQEAAPSNLYYAAGGVVAVMLWSGATTAKKYIDSRTQLKNTQMLDG